MLKHEHCTAVSGGAKASGSTNSLQRHLGRSASEWQIIRGWLEWGTHNLCQPWASIQKGLLLKWCGVMLNEWSWLLPCQIYITKWIEAGSCATVRTDSSDGGVQAGCLDLRISRTVRCLSPVEDTVSLRRRVEPQVSFKRKWRADLVLPFDISLTNTRLIFASSCSTLFLLFSRCRMVVPSLSRSSISPAFHKAMHLSRLWQILWFWCSAGLLH